MKKILIIAFICIGFTTQAQEIGIRLGSGYNNVAIDGVLNFDDSTRLHGDVTFGNGLGADLLYDFKLGKFAFEGLDFQWYLGAGLGTYIGNDFLLGVNGEAGLEYQFQETPISIGLDWRPQLYIISKTTLRAGTFGLNIRYRINSL